MPIKLHRCSNEWLKIAAHPCWKVQKALDDAGIDYELVKGPVRRGKRDELERLSGQDLSRDRVRERPGVPRTVQRHGGTNPLRAAVQRRAVARPAGLCLI